MVARTPTRRALQQVGAAVVLVGSFAGGAPGALAAPRPAPAGARYDLDILGFNGGEPYRLEGPAADALLAEPTATIFRFKRVNWMEKDPQGAQVVAARVTERYPHRAPSTLVAVYRLDLDGDGVGEMLLVPDNDAIADGRRYAPTVLARTDKGYKVLWAARALPGERYRVVDIRDLDGGGAPEVLLMGEAGRRSYYQFHEVVGRAGESFASLPVRHVDSVHYVDLDRDGVIEIVIRERVGRRGPAYQWTYVDHLYHWDGAQFVSAEDRFPRYQDEQTLPTLLGDLLDHYRAKLPILMEKVEAIKTVRAQTLAHVTVPRRHAQRVVAALAAIQRDQWGLARRRLEDLDAAYPYDPEVLVALARLHAHAARGITGPKARRRRWERALEAATRALTVTPQRRDAWWWAGVALLELRERSSAVASLVNVVRLCGKREEGVAFLKARRGEPGMDAPLQDVVDQALREAL